MYYGHEKVREMIRSRGGSSTSRIRATIHRSHRKQVRQALSSSRYNPEVLEEVGSTLPYKLDQDYSIKSRKRWGGSHAFTNWAIGRTRDLPIENRMSHIMGMFRNQETRAWVRNSIYWHDEMNPQWEIERAHRRWRGQRHRTLNDDDRADLLREIIETPGAHKLLNLHLNNRHGMVRWIIGYTRTVLNREHVSKWGNEVRRSKRPELAEMVQFVGPQRARTLQGLGDIESFLDDLHEAQHNRQVSCDPYVVRYYQQTHTWRPNQKKVSWITEAIRKSRQSPMNHPEWLRALDEFLLHWIKFHGDVHKMRMEFIQSRGSMCA